LKTLRTTVLLFQCYLLRAGVGTCGPHKHLIWPTIELSLPKLEYNIVSKRTIHDKQALKV